MRHRPRVGNRASNGPEPEDPLQERIARLEARLADMPPDTDAHVNALYSGIRSLVGELIRPFLPDTGDRVLKMLGVAPAHDSWRGLARNQFTPGTQLGDAKPLFPRIETAASAATW